MSTKKVDMYGNIIWFQDSEPHRTDGPAIIWADGSYEWVLKSHVYRFDDWCEKLNLSDEEIIMIKLKYG